MNEYYVHGFIDKCAEHGVDPVELAKYAGDRVKGITPGGAPYSIQVDNPLTPAVRTIPPTSTNTLTQGMSPARSSVPPPPVDRVGTNTPPKTVLEGMSGPAPVAAPKVAPQKPGAKSFDEEMAAWKSNPANKQVGLERQQMARVSPGG